MNRRYDDQQAIHQVAGSILGLGIEFNTFCGICLLSSMQSRPVPRHLAEKQNTEAFLIEKIK